MSDRNKVKDDQYREAALRLYARGTDVRVISWANVQRCEKGAFVEAMVWVPEVEAERSGL